MATLVLGAVGTAIGGAVGGTVLGLSGAAIGGMIGSAVGSMVDSWVIASMQPGQRYEGQRLDGLRLTSSTEGMVIPRVFGSARLGGNLIWATDFREEVSTETQGGGKGGGGGVTTTEYTYFVSFAVALCEGPIAGVGRVWVDGDLMDLTGVTWRLHRGTEVQGADPAIVDAMGEDATPAYRGTAYVVFDDLPVTEYGNRIPQITFEVFRPLADADVAEGLVPAVTLIPATGEFIYATEEVRKDDGAATENAHTAEGIADMTVSLDRLEALAPAVESVSLVVAWFGGDLRAGACEIRPGVELPAKVTSRPWVVNGVTRAGAHLVSTDDQDRPLYGGTPADFAVVQAIQEMKARGLRVTFYPFILMDIPADNALPDPYSDDAAGSGQATFPWRGRITCSPAAGYDGTVDKTPGAASQVADFFGAAAPSDFAVSGTAVSWTGGEDWGYRRMILHYAHLCDAAGGVDAFLIASEMRGLTQIRSGASTYPAVQELRDLLADVRSILGDGTKISYAADWSEYFGHHPQDGSGDVFFHLDPLWADDVDFIGIDNYMPLSDWRDGTEHADFAAGWATIYDRAYLQSNIEGGEGFGWYYASDSDRASQLRTPITDGAGKPWVYRYKDIRSWWSNAHHNRPGGVESGSATAWDPRSKPIRFTELGCPAIDRGPNQPNVFVDPKSSESWVPYFSRGWQDTAIQRAYLEATYLYWSEAGNNPVSPEYPGRMLDVAECAAWTWDARPYPFFPQKEDVWADAANWRLGHWLTGRLGSVSLAALVRHLCVRAGLPVERCDVSALYGAVDGYVISGLESPRTSLAMLGRHFGFDACESEGVIRFVMRGREPVLTVTPDDLAQPSPGAEVVEIVRAQETELPQALKWQVSRSDDEFDSVVVEARRITVESARVSSETFPIIVPPEETDRRCRRALMEAWTGRETATMTLPPSRLALDPTDVVRLAHDGRGYDLRITRIADGEARSLEAIRQDREVYDLPPGTARQVRLRSPVLFPAPEVVFLNLPILTEDQTPIRPLVAAAVSPWPGRMAVWRDTGDDAYERLTTFTRPARLGVLAFDLYSGPLWRWDYGNAMFIDLESGTLTSVTERALFRGANAFAVRSGTSRWEIVQARTVELVSPGRYRLTNLLRGQRGSEHAMADVVAAGARVVALDSALAEVPVSEADLGGEWDWRVGPARRPVTDSAYAEQAFTPRGTGLRPFSVVHISQPWRRGRVPGDLTISWVRRSRVLSADNWENGVLLAEEEEAYDVEILDGADIKRSLTAAATSVVYTAAQQTADWGAPLGPGDTLDVRVAQISAVVARGPAPVETLYF